MKTISWKFWSNMTVFVMFSYSLLYSTALQAQEDEGEEIVGDIYTQYPFLNEEANELFMPSPSALAPFFDKLHALELNQNQKIHVLHIGDSHIQADYFSGKVRALFREDRRFPMTSRGFTFPYRAAKTNNPSNYQVTYRGNWEGKKSVSRKEYSRWGLSGINAITYSANSSITINPNKEDEGFKIRKVKVFYPIYDSRSFQAEVVLEQGNQLTSYLMGDGYVEFSLLRPQLSVQIRFKKESAEQSQLILQGIWLESNDVGLTYSASGVNGAEVPTYFRCKDFYKQLAQLNPQLIVISLGTNDAFSLGFNAQRFKEDYRKLLTGIRRVLPNTGILLTTVGDSYRRRRYKNKNNAIASITILKLAEELGVAVWDFNKVMGGFQSIDKWHKNGLAAADKLHLSKEGYELQGELFFRALDLAYEEYCLKFHK